MHSVYMITDKRGDLLYIGCTSDIERRQHHHKSKAPWFSDSLLIHHRAFKSRKYAERVETRAIQLYRPRYNVLGNPSRNRKRTKAGIAAQKAAGKKFGRMPLIWKNGRGSPKRLAYLQGLENQGLLRDPRANDGQLIPKAADVTAELNKAKNMSKGDRIIENPESVRRWAREGYDGLKEERD